MLALACLGMAKKPPVAVRFHVEANARDGEVFAMPVKFHNPPRDGHVERVPTISERDIQAIYPAPGADGSMGCVFQLNRHGAFSLQTLSTEKRGASLVVFLSTKAGTHQVIDMLIDKPISDGIIYVPRGLTQMEVTALQKQFPLMGDSRKRKKT